MLTLKELKKLTAEELDTELAKATKDLFKIRFEVNTGSSKANHEIRKLRKYRAQVKTIKKQIDIEEKKNFKSQKEIAGSEEAPIENVKEEKAEKK